jgi:ribosomal protein S4
MVKLKVRVAWKENLLRQLRQGRTLTESTRLLKIGTSRINQECHRDPGFKQQMEEALGRRLDNIVSSMV